jgi:16S rRNA (cytosine967-C5)-methyltransferase
VEALDKSQSQIDKFKQNIKRLNIDIKITKKDFLNSKINSKYNSILLDAPCSALGTFRRNPDVISKIDKKKLKTNQDIQFKMVDKSLNLLNNGGVLVYIVCSFHSFETMGVIDKVLQKHRNITIEDIQSDKMIKKENGYFINPYSFKEYGGSDIFFVTVLRKQQ